MEGDFKIKQIEPQQIPEQESEPEKKRGGLISLFSRKNLPRTVFSIIFILLLVAVGAIIWGQIKFSKTNIQINIKTPQDIASGKEFTLTIEYTNDNRVNLNDVYLIVDYPSGVFSTEGEELPREQRSLQTIRKKSSGREDFKIRFVGDKGEFKNVSARLEYRPQNISSRFENSVSARIEINSVLISIKVDGPDAAMSGQEVEYIIEYENKANREISDLKIEIEYNEGFKIKNTNPEPMAGSKNIWQINTLKAGEKKSINLTGTLEGNEGEDKIIRATMGGTENEQFLLYSRSEYNTKIASSPLLLFAELEGIDEEGCNINSGDHLTYKITFKNNTDVAFKELILKTSLEDSVFDFRKVNLGGVGFFDSRENVITWAGGEVPMLDLLEPGNSGEVKFTVDIKKPIPMNSYNAKNFQAKIISEIGTLTVPAKFAISELKITKELSCKINTDLNVKSKAFYYDPLPSILNKGPLPPKVDEATTYAIHWEITNSTNDAENVRVSSVLPQGITWLNYYVNKVSNSQIYYNERTKEVTLEIPKIPAGVGYTLPVYEFIFQISLMPSINQIGQAPLLINDTIIEGRDTFTNITLRGTSSDVSTTIPDDPKAAYIYGRVVAK
jgi:hypothetical protein